MDWKSVGEKIVQDDQNKWDRKASAKELRVSETGALKVLNGHVEMPEYAALLMPRKGLPAAR